MTDEQTWQNACERVGLWKRGQRCTCLTFKGTVARGVYYCVKCKWMFNGVPSDPISRTHNIPAPAIGDSGGVLAMLAWLPAGYSVLKLQGGWCVMPLHSSTRPALTTLPLALAAAVCATSEDQ